MHGTHLNSLLKNEEYEIQERHSLLVEPEHVRHVSSHNLQNPNSLKVLKGQLPEHELSSKLKASGGVQVRQSVAAGPLHVKHVL